MFYPDKQPKKDVCEPYPLYQSEKGNYFIGQTPKLKGECQHALVALRNPSSSHVNIYVNAITVTNVSAQNISSEFYLRSTLNEGVTSNSVSCVNLAIIPAPIPKGKIKYLATTTEPPKDGVNIFSRIVSPYSTLVIDGGQIIISPGQSLVVYLGGFLPIAPNSTIVAFGWWEEKVCEYYDGYCK
ncbi:DUF6143 family protein [Paludicola sp. MB14-C6]|uniref:DUF6143 family protein n=1 Tax=Paludihabitans sp. MB14-C6 TaxID=3070656 RepID=UPI0027DE3D61|nr:DUF6143 family protein [Paludicola sp. MB14-C6]WMJ21937.1 DUF6143 family protein [Paludicola sp. MB14-C6]